jgi:hypothetical protein
MKSGVRIKHVPLLGGWFVVRGPHDTPISGKFESKKAARESLDWRK